MFERIGYYVTVVLWMTMPPAVLTWIVIHPLIRFWRARGPALAYLSVAGLAVLWAAGAFSFRRALAGEWLGPRWPLLALGLVLYGVAVWLEIACRRHLQLRTLVGVPELRGEDDRLITEGIYSLTRNPRYLAILVGTLGWALVFDYSGFYLLWALLVPAIYLVIFLEERELLARFGSAYADYRQRVPRLFPRRR